MTADVKAIVDVLKKLMSRAESPWADRKEAAAYAHCSIRTIDTAREFGFIKNYGGEEMPRFKKANLDSWIENGMPTEPNTELAKLILKEAKTK